jgi:dUTP pyrophosphatase
MNIVKFKVDSDDLVPQRASSDASGYDLRSSVDMVVKKNTPTLVPTGLFLDMESGWEAQVRPRSGLAAKSGVTVFNSPGTIDGDFKGEVKVILFSVLYDFVVNRGDRIAQIVFQQIPSVFLLRVDTLSESERGTGGFGSTGIN